MIDAGQATADELGDLVTLVKGLTAASADPASRLEQITLVHDKLKLAETAFVRGRFT